jgi:hypothetical protein
MVNSVNFWTLPHGPHLSGPILVNLWTRFTLLSVRRLRSEHQYINSYVSCFGVDKLAQDLKVP